MSTDPRRGLRQRPEGWRTEGLSMSTSSSSDRNPVEALAEEFLERRRYGERPTLEEYCRRYPELADDIRDLFPVLIRVEDLGGESSGASTGDPRPCTGTRLDRLGDFR